MATKFGEKIEAFYGAEKEEAVEGKTRNALLLGVGFLMGTVGVKALTSERAKRVYVQGVAAGLQAKSYYEDVVEQAKAEVDDIVAEASYLSSAKADAGAKAGAAAEPVAESAAEAEAGEKASA